ncbi:MAG: hypothetical protein AB4040_16925 [Synechococcus sp.]
MRTVVQLFLREVTEKNALFYTFCDSQLRNISQSTESVKETDDDRLCEISIHTLLELVAQYLDL